MPDRHVLHVADALALGGLADDHERLVALAAGDGLEHGSRVVPVDLGALPAERLELLHQRIERRMGLGGPPKALEVVVIDEGYEIGAAERGGHHYRLPGR